MHPEIQQDKPGLCPECGMSLLPQKVKKEQEQEHNKHAGHSVNIFAGKFWVSLVLSFPVILYSDIFETLFGKTAPDFLGSEFIPLVLGSVIFFYGGLIFLQGAVRELKAKLPGMMTLIALAITVAYFYSIGTVIFEAGHDLFWELATLITIMLLGHWLEMRAVTGAQGALKELSKLIPDKAEMVRGETTETVSVRELRVGDIVLVRPGSKVPADSIVIDGDSELDESMISGESRPVFKTKETELIAGTINSGDGALKAKVSKVGENTFLAGVMRLIAEAQASKSRLQLLSDRAAFHLTWIAITAGAVTFFSWVSLGSDVSFALTRTVAVLVIACPHALGLAIPLVASISTSLAATGGFLVKQRSALESARSVDTVIFDKTGTLTKGEFGVETVILNDGIGLNINTERLIQLAASVDFHSEHFVSKAIVQESKDKNLKLLEVKEFKRLPGRGVSGSVDGFKVLVGGESLLSGNGINLRGEFADKIGEFAAKGKTISYVIINNEPAGAIILADVVREESREAVTELKKLGKRVVMLTGDSEEVAKWVAKDIGIDEFFAKVLPQNKAEKVGLLQSQGRKVAMVGDGINDAPALAQADLGVAIGAGTNVAIESAGIILVKNDPRDIVKIINLSKATYSKMIQNLFWATGYNVIALPLAAGVLVSKGILLQPALAAVFMSLSTVIVAVNAVLLRKQKI